MSYYILTINRKDIFLIDSAGYQAVIKQIDKENSLNFTSLNKKDHTKREYQFIRWPSILNISIVEAVTNEFGSSPVTQDYSKQN